MMRLKLLFALMITSMGFISCQKEVDFSDADGTGGTGGSGGNTNGDLVVKAYQITTATHDTDFIFFSYDANKRILSYDAEGAVNGTPVDLHYTFSRDADGKVTSIKAVSEQPGIGTDSSEYTPVYISGTAKFSYVLNVHYTAFGEFNDSIAFTYNADNKIAEKETFSEAFGISLPASKEVYTYDGSGNITIVKVYTSDGAGGYDLLSTTTNTYNTHKAGFDGGDECYIVLGAENVSPNSVTSKVTDLDGDVVNYTFTGMQYNSFDRPTIGTLSISPTPPGYSMKLVFFYQ